MPVIKARTPEGARSKIVNEFGELFGPVFECDTDEGWIKFYLVWPNGKYLVDHKDQKIATAKLYTSFKVLDRETNEVKYSVKWNMIKDNSQIIKAEDILNAD